MRSFIRSTFLAIFMLSSAAVWGADLERGLAAFAEGDYETALAECQPLADEGNVEAMFCVGRMYANGFGVPMDDALALKWYGLAAGEGHGQAQYKLGLMHANGWGVAMNDVPAAGFYRLAAGNGVIEAQAALGYCYKHGAGVQKDLAKAYMWFDIAAQNDDLSAASERDNLGDRLTEQEILAARRSALQWLESYEGSAMHAGRLD
jgi:TPR repeat protein